MLQFKVDFDKYNSYRRFTEVLFDLNEFLDKEVGIEDLDHCITGERRGIVPKDIIMLDMLLDLLPLCHTEHGVGEFSSMILKSEFITKDKFGEDKTIKIHELHDDWDYLVEHKIIHIYQPLHDRVIQHILEESEFPLDIFYSWDAKEAWEKLEKEVLSRYKHWDDFLEDSNIEPFTQQLVLNAVKVIKNIREVSYEFDSIAEAQKDYFQKEGPKLQKKLARKN